MSKRDDTKWIGHEAAKSVLSITLGVAVAWRAVIYLPRTVFAGDTVFVGSRIDDIYSKPGGALEYLRLQLTSRGVCS